MAYTLGFPTVGQSLGNSRVDVLNNWQSLFDFCQVNHIGLNLTGAGKHTSMQIVQGAQPATLSNEIGVYTTTVVGNLRILMRYPSNGVSTSLTGEPPSFSATQYSTFLPCGMRLVGKIISGAISGNIAFGITFAQLPLISASIISNNSDQRTIQFTTLTTSSVDFAVLDEDSDPTPETISIMIIGRV